MKNSTLKLLAKRRLIPILKTDDKGIWITGYNRRKTSRKAHQKPLWLQVPILYKPTEQTS